MGKINYFNSKQIKSCKDLNVHIYAMNIQSENTNVIGYKQTVYLKLRGHRLQMLYSKLPSTCCQMQWTAWMINCGNFYLTMLFKNVKNSFVISKLRRI